MSSSFSRSRESARAVGLRARIECIRALRTISSVEKELNLLFSPLFLLEGVSSRYARKKNRARARARDPNESSDAGENESRRFFSRARIVLRVRAILARVVVVVAARARLQQISKGERWGRSRRNVSHVRSRKNPKNARVASSAPFSCRPSIAQNSYREASSKMVSRANSPSPRKTRRRVNTPTTRGWCLSAPHQICADVVVSFFFLCVFSLVFFALFLEASTHAGQANRKISLFFV